MRKLAFFLAITLGISACGVPKAEHEALQSKYDALQADFSEKTRSVAEYFIRDPGKEYIYENDFRSTGGKLAVNKYKVINKSPVGEDGFLVTEQWDTGMSYYGRTFQVTTVYSVFRDVVLANGYIRSIMDTTDLNQNPRIIIQLPGNEWKEGSVSEGQRFFKSYASSTSVNDVEYLDCICVEEHTVLEGKADYTVFDYYAKGVGLVREDIVDADGTKSPPRVLISIKQGGNQ